MATKKPKKPRKMKTKAQPKDGEVLALSWKLGELPSSQHRTGLAGLVLMVRWLERHRKLGGLCRLKNLDASGVTLEVNERGLQDLFNETYGAELVERSELKVREGKPPKRVEEREVETKKVDRKTGEPVVKTVTYYVYDVVEPKGAFLAELDNPKSGKSGLWIKLWRDFIWSLVRAVPKTRGPYISRAEGGSHQDAQKAWAGLAEKPEASVKLPSTYFIGAQTATAENVPFRDRERFQFLLHFWPFAIGLAVPCTIDREGASKFEGYVLSFSDVADLATFCDEFEGLLRNRKPTKAGYRPKDALVDLPAEGALQLLSFLEARLKEHESRKRVSDLVHGVDVFHVEREGNNVRVRSSMRIEPSVVVQSEYERIRSSFHDPIFRRQRLLNLLAGVPWYSGFDRLMATLPSAHFIAGRAQPGEYGTRFPHDARTQFKHVAPEAG